MFDLAGPRQLHRNARTPIQTAYDSASTILVIDDTRGVHPWGGGNAKRNRTRRAGTATARPYTFSNTPIFRNFLNRSSGYWAGLSLASSFSAFSRYGASRSAALAGSAWAPPEGS